MTFLQTGSMEQGENADSGGGVITILQVTASRWDGERASFEDAFLGCLLNIDLPQPLIHTHTCIHVCTHMHVCSHGRLFVTPWTVVHQAPLSMEFSRILEWVAISFSNTYAYTHTYVYICTHMCVCLRALNHIYRHKYICVYVYV